MSAVLTGRRRPADDDAGGGGVGDQQERERSLRSRSRVVEWVALFAALAPIVGAVVRAALTGWMPLFDAGYFMVRSRDVFTEHHPLLGAWSMGSKSIGASLNNLGPLQLDLLAPFTKLFPYWGTAVGTGLINAGAVIGVWVVARRMFGTGGALGAMIATLCLEATMASWMLIEPRQQLALLLPLWCLLWLTSAMWTGAAWSLPWTVFVASLIAQTHFSFVYQALAVVVAGSVGFALSVRRSGQPAGPRRALVVSSVVAFVCWAQTLWDVFFGTGNFLRVLANGGGAGGVGFSDGARYVAGATLTPPFWTPGYMGRYLRPSDDIISMRAAWFAIAVWMALLVIVALIGRHLRRPPVVAMGVIGASVVAAAVYAAANIPPTADFGIVAYNYYWMWPIGIFVTTAVVVGAVVAVLSLLPVERLAHSTSAVRLGAACCVLLALPVLRPLNYLPETDHEASAGERVGRPLMEQLSTSLDRLDIEGPLVIDRSRESHASYFPYTMLAELQRHGVEFTFPVGDISIDRFGRERCEDGTSPHRLIVADGEASLTPAPDEVVLAQVDGMSAQQYAELSALQVRFGDLIRDGTVAVDVPGLSSFGHETSPIILSMLENPQQSAAGLAKYLANWRVFGVVQVPEALEADFLRWHDLEQQAIYDRVAIFLGPNLVQPTNACETSAGFLGGLRS